MWASDRIKKFALIGTSCSGKTTLCLSILAHLKGIGVLCDGVLQQDRRFAFDRAQLELYKEAQYYFICNQIMRESELTLRGHAEVLVSDRSVLDLYAYYEAMFGEDKKLFGLVTGWCKTYTALYYLPPLPYVDDKARPSDKFRMKVDRRLRPLLNCIPEVRQMPIDRASVLDDILKMLGKKLTDVDLNVIPYVLKNADKIMVGGSYAFNRATKWSDVDVYVLDYNNTFDKEHATAELSSILGITVHLHVVTSGVVWDYLRTQGFKEFTRRSYE
jgi:predicted nucleotidyltransferase